MSNEATGSEATYAEADSWPRCPQCDARRATQCPVCGTAGTDFPPADSDFLAPPEVADDARPVSCGCGSGGCSSQGHSAEDDAAPAAGDGPADATPEMPDPMLMCTTCDEPFVPEHPRRCEWCGHEFADGYEVEQPQDGELITARAIAVIFALLALLTALLVYFMVIV